MRRARDGAHEVYFAGAKSQLAGEITLGPTLTQFGIAGALANPQVVLTDPNGTPIAANDDWKTSQQALRRQAMLRRTMLKRPSWCSFQEANTLPSSVGNNGDTGVALVEVYHVPGGTAIG